jgi:hypothetical protein
MKKGVFNFVGDEFVTRDTLRDSALALELVHFQMNSGGIEAC